MTPQEISQIYETLERLEIKLEQIPEMGTEYLKDKLLECRQKQNTVTDLIVKTNRAYSGSRMAVRAQEAAVRVAGMSARGAELREQLSTMLDERDSLKYLLEALSVRRANLGRTSSDIRLMAGIIEQESRPGNANAGPQRPAPPPPPPTSLPPLDPPHSPAPPETFETGMADIVAKVKAQEDAAVPLVEASEILAPTREVEMVEVVKNGERKVENVAGTKTPPPPTLADDDEISMDEFLES